MWAADEERKAGSLGKIMTREAGLSAKRDGHAFFFVKQEFA